MLCCVQCTLFIQPVYYILLKGAKSDSFCAKPIINALAVVFQLLPQQTRYPQRANQPKKRISNIANDCIQPEEKEDYLNSTDDGEASEESHGASNETQLGLCLDLLVSLDVVEGGRVEVDLNQLDC